MPSRPARLRRSQLAVPGISEKMLAKAAQSKADHVFCDLEDAVAPAAKVAARKTIVSALNNLDWGKKTRCVKINDVGTPWCYEDVIEIVEGARENVDVIMLPKARHASDVAFLSLLLDQIELKLGLSKRIGIEVLIEETEGLENVGEIARASDRLEALIFGMGDYSASQQIDVREIGAETGYPGDIFHFAQFKIAMTARAAGIDPVDGPFGNFNNSAAYTREAKRAAALGMVGKWAIHPNQIAPALEVFSPREEEVAFARKVTSAYEKAVAEGIGSISVDGIMVDAASVRLVTNTVRRADLIGM